MVFKWCPIIHLWYNGCLKFAEKWKILLPDIFKIIPIKKVPKENQEPKKLEELLNSNLIRYMKQSSVQKLRMPMEN